MFSNNVIFANSKLYMSYHFAVFIFVVVFLGGFFCYINTPLISIEILGRSKVIAVDIGSKEIHLSNINVRSGRGLERTASIL